MQIRNWRKFQPPMKDRNVIWIKVYRQILEDYEWHNLTSDSKATLIELLLLASEANGQLPEVHKIAFRLRKSEDYIKKQITLLSHWLQDDNNLITTCEQDVPLEKSKSREEESKKTVDRHQHWDRFLKVYPSHGKRNMKIGKERWATKKCDNHIDAIIKHVNYMKETHQWKVDKKVPHVSTYLNQERWKDPIDDNNFWEGAL